MSEEILINVTPQETRVAVIYLGAVQELHIERASQKGLVGNVYLGRVSRVLPGMQSAFIDIGLDRAAFLHVGDIVGARSEHNGLQPIEKVLHEGQSILVQVIKDPISAKGARLSTQISMAGRFLVYLPQETRIGISQKIEDESERELLRERLTRILPVDGKGGFIIRTMANLAEDGELAADVEYLHTLWDAIQARSENTAAPAPIYQELDLAHRVLRDFATAETERILVDSRETWQRMKGFADEFTRNVADKISHYAADRPLFELYSVEEEIEKALGRRVDLKSGGYLIVDQTEALTTIDVNTGGFVGSRNFDDTIFKTNLEAAHAIARQLRLRNLGGIIIVDFIDMQREQLSKDRTKVTVSGFTGLGLVEMTRKRTRESLAHMLCEACPVCMGKGTVRTSRTVAYDILREILREARQFNPREYRVIAAPKVIELFLDEESQHLAGLSDFIGKPISLQSESAMGQEQYDIVLL